MIVMSALLACQEPAVAPAPPTPATAAKPAARPLITVDPTFTFTELAWDDAFLTNAGPTATKSALINGTYYPIDYHVLGRTGDVVGDQIFGQTFDLGGSPIEEACNQQDFDALFQSRGALWLTSHFECTPGALYLSKLAQDPQGMLSIESTKNVDFNAHGGLYNPCAGQITPWGTHLASEEYEPDAFEEPTSLEKHGWDYLSWSRMKKAAAGKTLRPYDYGWIPEVAVMTPDGDTLVVKHKALGRASHEIAVVLPDERTVYLSDDGRGGALYMFVADKPAQLSAGTLYAARFQQESERAGGAGLLQWVSLGHATDGEIDGAINGGAAFSDLFERELPTEGTTCPTGFRFVDQDAKAECLKLQAPTEAVPDPGKLASRLETRRYAAYMGATTEFEKGEGIAYNPDRQVLYVAFAKIGGRMVEEAGYGPIVDHIRLAENPCGAVWSGRTTPGAADINGQPIASELVLSSFGSLVAGGPMEADAQGNTCSPAGPANPDNLALLPGYDLLMIAEDTKRHAVANLWSLDLRKSRLRRVMVAPPHGEITGISWSLDLQGFGYLTVAVQHPWQVESLTEESTLPDGITAADQRSITGYLGPFPALAN